MTVPDYESVTLLIKKKLSKRASSPQGKNVLGLEYWGTV